MLPCVETEMESSEAVELIKGRLGRRRSLLQPEPQPRPASRHNKRDMGEFGRRSSSFVLSSLFLDPRKGSASLCVRSLQFGRLRVPLLDL